MKKLFVTLFLSAFLLLSVAKTSMAQEYVLPEVTLECSQTHADVTLGIGVLSVTIHVLITACNNGDVYIDVL